MSTTTSGLPGIFSPPPPPPPPQGSPPPGSPDDQPKSSSLYLFTFLSTLFLLLVVSTAIVLRAFLLRRRYHTQLQEQFDDIFRPPRDARGASRKRNFGAKPKLWETWIQPDDQQNNSVKELADIKPLSVAYIPQEPRPRDLSAATPGTPPPQERRHERSTALFSSLFANPLPRQLFENDHPGDDSPNQPTEIPHTVQISVVISMPTLTPMKPRGSNTGEEEFPNVALGFTQLPTTNN